MSGILIMRILILRAKNKIIGAVVGRMNALVRKSYWYNEIYWQGATKFWSHNVFGLDVVNTGSNTGKYAFDYSNSGIRGFNMALGPQSLVHDFNILKNYFSYLKRGAKVIIPLGPFSCLHSKYNRAANFKYYTFLHPATIVDFDEDERSCALMVRGSPFRVMPRTCLMALFREAKAKLVFKLCNRQSQIKDFDSSALSFLHGWMKQFGIANLESPLTNKHIAEFNQRVDVLRNMIDFCVERSFSPILVIPPMHKTLASRLPIRFVENYVESFVRAVNRPDIPFYNDMNMVLSDDCFSNALFLNKHGALIYTSYFLDKITEGQ